MNGGKVLRDGVAGFRKTPVAAVSFLRRISNAAAADVCHDGSNLPPHGRMLSGRHGVQA